MYISEISTTVPEDERGVLETKVYEELTRLNIPFERVDNDSVETMDECGLQQAENTVLSCCTSCKQEIRFKTICCYDENPESVIRIG